MGRCVNTNVFQYYGNIKYLKQSNRYLYANYAKEKGFTLVELAVVIGVIGVLASVILVMVDPVSQLQKARNTQRKSDLVQIQRMLELFYNDNNAYPPSLPALAPDYMNEVPTDPNGGDYLYSPTQSGQGYLMYATLENADDDAQACNDDGSRCAGAGSVAGCGTAACNYGVASPNETP